MDPWTGGWRVGHDFPVDKMFSLIRSKQMKSAPMFKDIKLKLQSSVLFTHVLGR